LTGAGDDREVPGRREARDHLPVRRTLARIGVPPATFYRWYDRYRELGPEGLEDRSPPTGPGVEPYPRAGAGAHSDAGAGGAGAVVA
jgi:hypothetical protein